MKRKIILGLVVVFASILLSSCHMNEICPAYADSDIEVEQNA
jgi:hypothetical protein